MVLGPCPVSYCNFFIFMMRTWAVRPRSVSLSLFFVTHHMNGPKACALRTHSMSIHCGGRWQRKERESKFQSFYWAHALVFYSFVEVGPSKWYRNLQRFAHLLVHWPTHTFSLFSLFSLISCVGHSGPAMRVSVHFSFLCQVDHMNAWPGKAASREKKSVRTTSRLYFLLHSWGHKSKEQETVGVAPKEWMEKRKAARHSILRLSATRMLRAAQFLLILFIIDGPQSLCPLFSWAAHQIKR